MMLTPKDVRTAKLNVHRFCEGYDIDEVDNLLDDCADTIEALAKALESTVKTRSGNNGKEA